MRVLYAITLSEFGGAQSHLLQLINHFRRKGFEVGLVVNPDGFLFESAKGLKVKTYPNPYFCREIRPWRDLLAFNTVFWAIKRFKPDIVHAHSTKAGVFARIAGRLNGVRRIVFTAHGWIFTEGTPAGRKIIGRIMERAAAPFCDKVICVSEQDRNLALKHKIVPEHKVVTIYNGIEVQDYINKSPNPDHFHIVFVGRLHRPKDPFTLLRALSLIKKEKNCPLRLTIIGDGELRKEAEEFVLSHNLSEVRLLGSLPHEEVMKILKAADTLVLTSNYEGFPIVLLEAMSLGLPVIATRIGGVPELVEDGVNGFLVGRQDVQGVATALVKLAKDEDLRLRMGREGWRKVKERFSLHRMLEDVERVYLGEL
ncbi:MAG: glycosyltransferase family 4 protein [candidate division WOR-3 bacterium]